MASAMENTDCSYVDFSCVQTYVINLDDSHERLARVRDQLMAADVDFRRIQAVDGRKVSAKSFSEYDDRLARRRYGRPLSGGEAGCFLSHRRCVQEFLNSEYEYALVLEDDVFLPANLRRVLMRLVNWLHQSRGPQWDVVNLGNAPRKLSQGLTRLKVQQQELELQAAYYFPLGTFGLLWSRSGAKRFLEQTHTIYAPVDQFLRDWCAVSGQGLALTPALIGVDRSQSYIRHRLIDRMKLNLLFYWVMKNVRLARNHYNARATMAQATAVHARLLQTATTSDYIASDGSTVQTTNSPVNLPKLDSENVSNSRKRCA
jgi:glycosyl transferase family 25